MVSETISATGVLRSAIVPDDLRANVARFLRRMYGGRARQLGWNAKPGESDDTRTLRRLLVGLVAIHGEDEELIAEAQKLARRWLDDHKAVDPEMTSTVMNVAAAHGDQALFDRVHGTARLTQDHRERELLIGAMASFHDPAIVNQRLGLLLTDEFDPREAFFAFLFPAPREARRMPFEFVRQDLDALLKKLPREVGADFAADLPAVGGGFCDASERADLEAFFKPRVDRYTGGPRNLAQMLERIDLCIARKQALGPSLAEFLKKY